MKYINTSQHGVSSILGQKQKNKLALNKKNCDLEKIAF